MLKSLKTILSIQLLFWVSMNNADADTLVSSASVCSAKSTRERTEAFISHYELNSLYTKMKELKGFSASLPLENSSYIQEELFEARTIFVTNEQSVLRFRGIMKRLIESGDESLYVQSQAYSRELYFAVEQINIEVSDILDVDERLEERARLMSEVKTSLISRHSVAYFANVESNDRLSDDEKRFLKDVTFHIVPGPPGYNWRESATMLGSYVWTVLRNSNAFEFQGGYISDYAKYRLETMANSDHPGLHLNLVYRRQEGPSITFFDLRIIYSPFTDTIPIEVCDYRFLNYKGDCISLDINNWCEHHGY